MAFRRKKFSTAEEMLSLIKSDNEIMHSTAVIYFHRSDKVSGKLYLRKGNEPGLVYAAHVSNMPFEIGKRLKPYIDPEDYEDIIRQVGGDDTDPNIARLVISKQLVSEKVVESYIREYLFAAATEIFSWEEVISKWEVGIETRDFASKQHIKLDLLQQRSEERTKQYEAIIAETKLDEEQVDQLKVLINGEDEDFENITNQNLVTIINEINGKATIEDIRNITGMLKVPTFMSIHSLWKAGLVKLVAGDIPIYPPVTVIDKLEEEESIEHVEAIPLDLHDEESPLSYDKPDEAEADDFIVGETVEDETIDINETLDVNDEEKLSDVKDDSKSELDSLLESFNDTPVKEETQQASKNRGKAIVIEPLEEVIVEDSTVEIVTPQEEIIPTIVEEKPQARTTRRTTRKETKDSPTVEPKTLKKETVNTSNNNLSILDKINNRISELQDGVENVAAKIRTINKDISLAEVDIADKEAKVNEAIEYKDDLIDDLKEYQNEHNSAQKKLDEMIEKLDSLLG